MKKKYIYVSIFFLILIPLLIYLYPPKIINTSHVEPTNNENNIQKIDEEEIVASSSNTMDQVSYSSRDLKGNEYIIEANEGEIDISNSNIIYLKKVKAYIKLIKKNEMITISSDFGKYNTVSYDTIFSKNVEVDYIDNNLTGNYLDFSMMKNTLIMSKNVVYTNPDNILIADVVKLNTVTKDTKIFMHNSKEKVEVKSKN